MGKETKIKENEKGGEKYLSADDVWNYILGHRSRLLESAFLFYLSFCTLSAQLWG